MNADDITISGLMQNDVRQDERLRVLEKWESEYREMISCMHKMNANVEILTQRVKENSDIIKEHVSQQAAQYDELRRYVDETVKDLRAEIDDRFKAQGERIGQLSKEPGEKAKKSWETVKYAAITAVVSIIITAVVSYFIYVS